MSDMTTTETCDKCGLVYRSSLIPHQCAEWTKGRTPMSTGNRDDDNCAYIYEKAQLMRCGRSREQHRVAGLSHNFVSSEIPEGAIAFIDGTLRDAKNTDQLFRPQPAPETGGEWCEREPVYGGFADDADMLNDYREWHVGRNADEVFDSAGIAVALGCGLTAELRAQHAAQIVADHSALPLAVALLQDFRDWLTYTSKDGTKGSVWPEWIERIDTVLAAATGQRSE